MKRQITKSKWKNYVYKQENWKKEDVEIGKDVDYENLKN